MRPLKTLLYGCLVGATGFALGLAVRIALGGGSPTSWWVLIALVIAIVPAWMAFAWAAMRPPRPAWVVAMAVLVIGVIGLGSLEQPATVVASDHSSGPGPDPDDKPMDPEADQLTLDRQTRTLAAAEPSVSFAVPPWATRALIGYGAKGSVGSTRNLSVHQGDRELATVAVRPARPPSWSDLLVELAPDSGELRIQVEGTGDAAVKVSQPAFLREPEGTRRNLIFISIDTLRADYLGAYGYDLHPTSPNLDLLAERGTLFEWAIAPSPWTIPSHMALFTGMHPDAIGMGELLKRTPRLSRDVPTLAKHFSDAGYLSVAFTGTATMGARHGFADGFHLYQEAYNRKDALQRDLDTNIYLATRWLEEHRQEPLFLFFHTFEVHDPYVHQRFADTSLRGRRADPARYASGIAYTDGRLAEFLETLEEMGLLEDSLLVITSDHGESLGPVHRYHGRHLYDDVMHVPLIMVGPDVPAGRRIGTQVPLVDLFATLLDAFDLPIPTGIDSKSFLPLLREPGAPRPAYLCCLAHGRQQLGLRADGYKYVITPGKDGAAEELYDLDRDPREVTNLSGILGRTTRRLREWTMRTAESNLERGTAKAPALRHDREYVEQLRALGYIQ